MKAFRWRRSTKALVAGGTAAAVLTLAAAASVLAASPRTGGQAKGRQAQAEAPPPPESILPSLAPLAERLSPTVVSIGTIRRIRAPERPDRFQGGIPMPFRFFFGDPTGPFGWHVPEFENRGSGSGVIVDRDGYILTNAHVVKDANEVTVQISTGESHPAEVIGLDEPTDLALLRIHAGRALPAAAFGDSDRLAVGDWVVAIGNPFGLEHTVTAGIVSAKERRVGRGASADLYGGFIQTDASINPGNSGGPLFDLAGRMVGINTAINAAGQGIGFAIPANMAKAILGHLRESGRVVRSWIGVTIQTVTPELSESFGLHGRARGALVAHVAPGSPAERAGVRRGDIILRFDDQEIGDAGELPWLASTAGVGRNVRLQIWRDGARRDVTAALEAMPQTGGAAQAPVPAAPPPPAREGGGVGLHLRDVPANVRAQIGIESGGAMVERVDPSGPAADRGIRPGDVVLEVDGRTVQGAQDAADAMQGRAKSDVVRLLVRTRQGTRYVGIRLR